MKGASRVFVWGFSPRFAVFEAEGSFPRELLQKNQPKPTVSEWPRPSLIEVLERGRSSPIGDFPATSGFMHLLSPRAVDGLGEWFANFGILFPVSIKHAPEGWCVFHPTNVVDCLDLEHSKVSRLPFQDRRIVSVDRPVFVDSKVPAEGIFIVPECPYGHTYVCEDLKRRVIERNLKGLCLLTAPGEPAWVS